MAALLSIASIGGLFIYTAPLLLPLYWVAARDSPWLGAAAWIVLAGIQAAEVSWAAAYSAAGGDTTLVAVVAALTLISTVTVYAIAWRRRATGRCSSRDVESPKPP